MKSRYKLELSVKFCRQFRRLDKPMRLSVFKGLRDLVADPLSGKFLKGRLRRSWFFRVGDFRVIYEFSGDVVSVVSVEHRSVVYDE